jgi:hypothetical protein
MSKRKIDLPPNFPMTKPDGSPSQATVAVMQEIAKMLRDLEARIEALEP